MRERKKSIIRSIKKKEYNLARDQCKEYLEIEEEDAKVHMYMAYCYSQIEMYEDAYEWYKKTEKCVGAKEIAEEITLGIAAIFYKENKYFDRYAEKQKEEIDYIEKAIEIYKNQKKIEQQKEYVLYLLEIFAYTKIHSYLVLAKKYLEIEESDSNDPEKISLSSEEKKEVLFKYITQSLAQFHVNIQALIEQNEFTKSRVFVIEILKIHIERQKETEKYISIILKKDGNNNFLLEIFDTYLSYLGLKVYIDSSAMNDVFTLLEIGNTAQKDMSAHIPMIELLCADYLDIPLIITSLQKYKGHGYNTLSPTVLLLRFPDRKEICYAVYTEFEQSLNTEYKMKRECLAVDIHKKDINERVLRDTQYKGEEEIRNMKEKHVFPSCPLSISIFLEEAYRTTHFPFLQSVLENAFGYDMLSVSPQSMLERIEKSTRNPWLLCKVQSKLFSLASVYLSFELPHIMLAIESLYIQLMYAHICIVNYKASNALYVLNQTSQRVEQYKHTIRNIQVSPEQQKIYARIDNVYAYGEFLARYLRKIAAAYKTDNEIYIGRKKVLNELYHKKKVKKRILLFPTAYTSPYSHKYLLERYSPELESISPDLFKYPNTTISPFLKHMIAMENTDPGGDPRIALDTFQMLYQNKPNDFFLVSDMTAYLSRTNREAKALFILEEYQRERINRQEYHLLLLSLQLSREAKNWQSVEKRCKEVLISTGYNYKVKMALSEALAEQRKYEYALSIAEEIIATEKNFNNRVSANIFLIYLSIRTGQIKDINNRIDELISESEKENASSFFVQTLIRYKKYICAKEIQNAIAVEGKTLTLSLLHTYTSLLSTTTSSSHFYQFHLIDSYIQLVNHLFTGHSLDTFFSLPETVPQHLSEEQQQKMLITIAKLLLLSSSATDNLHNPQIHQKISSYLKQASSVLGKTKESLEIEYLVRIIRKENVSSFYQGEYLSERTSFTRVVHSLVYDAHSLPVSSREYVKTCTLLDMPFLRMIGHMLCQGGNNFYVPYEDIETVFLHLCRLYLPDDPAVEQMYKRVKQEQREKNAPDGDRTHDPSMTQLVTAQ